jgi:hypothetical protein
MTGYPHLTHRWPCGHVTEELPTIHPEHEPWLLDGRIALSQSEDLLLADRGTLANFVGTDLRTALS